MSDPAQEVSGTRASRAAAWLDPRTVRDEVRREVLSALGRRPAEAAGSAPPDRAGQRSLVTESDVAAARNAPDRKLYMPRATLVTPLARDAAERYGVTLVEGDPPAAAAPLPSRAPSAPPSAPTRSPSLSAAPSPSGVPGRSTRSPRRPNLSASPEHGALAAAVPGPVAIGSDHAGFALKDAVRRHLESRGVRVMDFGTANAETSVDYPDFVIPAAAAVARGVAWRGVVVDCHGNASAMTANKVPGIRAAASRTLEEIQSSREHNDINVLCLGQKVLAESEARAIVDSFLAVAFAGDRHARRIGKVAAVEQAFCRNPMGTTT